MSSWLITGGSGFLGGHMAGALPSGVDAVMLGRRRPPGWTGRFAQADLADREALRRALEAVSPEVVLHLAGRTPPASATEYFQDNTRNTWHLVSTLASTGRACRIVLAGSAAEDLPPGGRHGSYGLSKWAATRVGHAQVGPINVVSARIHNPIGPGMSASQAFGRFASTLAQPGPDPLRLTVGDLDARRDFVDARDVCDALVALAHRGRPGRMYPVGTGIARRVGEGLDALIERSGRRVIVESTTLGSRTGSDPPRADLAPILGDTKWSPRVEWSRSIDDLWGWASRIEPGRQSA